MSIHEVYETAQSLRALKRNVDLPNNSIRCLVTQLIPTRPREYVSGTVFTVMGSLRVGPDGAQRENIVRLHFYNEWAYGASFVDPGDVLLLRGFRVLDIPTLPPENTQPDGEEHPFVVMALAKASSLRVVQLGDQGDTMEVTVLPGAFDHPRIRALPRTDRNNHCFANDVKNNSM